MTAAVATAVRVMVFKIPIYTQYIFFLDVTSWDNSGRIFFCCNIGNTQRSPFCSNGAGSGLEMQRQVRAHHTTNLISSEVHDNDGE